ncbi:hypothetical protein [Clostridium thermarum]|uniref:hypothetical protein n=1 Tax=Clostridium thermarum TaxID=1716543 RepID=UPI0013D02FBE|nr:hypothetical protein [Clostridium thermarum]
MDNQTLIYITIFSVVFGVIGIVVGLVPFLKKKGFPMGAFLGNAKNVVNRASEAVTALDKVMPDNVVINVLEIISKWAKIAVGNAEQLYHAGEIDKLQRAEVANKVVYDVLKILNIEVTDALKPLIEAAIKEAVNALGHETLPQSQ